MCKQRANLKEGPCMQKISRCSVLGVEGWGASCLGGLIHVLIRCDEGRWKPQIGSFGRGECPGSTVVSLGSD